ncbi:chemotaxis protein CheW [Halobiforma nitratireducens]|uniref:Chemotaxis protein CheW n=1 Tax=Halobiforma nitratireducens JCM 10879 TaxID=1227454 RepID=M0M9V9_9EURY|nr:chemotaxis protein CheW [Halobiforma nitratireducens]EMA42567.1 chemotaxis protein CheW [Halobiforma nitratireducens JCM 10879]
MPSPSDVDDTPSSSGRKPRAEPESESCSGSDSSDGSDPKSLPERLQILTFTLGDERYCVRTDAVATVLGVSDAAPIVRADDPWNAASISVDGERVRVVHLARVFATSSASDTPPTDPKLLVLGHTDGDGRYYGWLVDRVGTTETVTRDALEPTRVTTSHVEGRFVFEDGDAILVDERVMLG